MSLNFRELVYSTGRNEVESQQFSEHRPSVNQLRA